MFHLSCVWTRSFFAFRTQIKRDSDAFWLKKYLHGLHRKMRNCTIARNLMIYNTQETEWNADISKETTSMSNQMTPSLHTLPVELVYRILDNLDDKAIFLSCRNICTRLNAITDTYRRYQVTFDFIMKAYTHHLWTILFFSKKYIILITFLVYDFKKTDFIGYYSILGCILSMKRIQRDLQIYY
jgi:hypothetical protein